MKGNKTERVSCLNDAAHAVLTNHLRLDPGDIMSALSVVGSVARGMSHLSGAQQSMLDAAPKDMQDFLAAQMKMQKEQEITQFITQMMKALHEMSMGVIKNIG